VFAPFCTSNKWTDYEQIPLNTPFWIGLQHQKDTMRVLKSLLQIAAVTALSQTILAASWTFSDGSISVQGKGSGVGSGLKEK
jgi:hypothetical protein